MPEGETPMKNVKKYIAPIIITAVLVLYYVVLAVILLETGSIRTWLKLLLVTVPLGLCAVAVGVLIERIKEINSGETDDLDKY